MISNSAGALLVILAIIFVIILADGGPRNDGRKR